MDEHLLKVYPRPGVLVADVVPQGPADDAGVRCVAVQARQLVGIARQIEQLPLADLVVMNELVRLRADSVLAPDRVPAWILEVLVVDRVAPVRGRPALQQRGRTIGSGEGAWRLDGRTPT